MLSLHIRKTSQTALLLAILSMLAACDNLFDVPAFQSCPATLGGNLALHTPGAPSGDLAWPSWGKDLANSHDAGAAAGVLSVSNVAGLGVDWIFNTSGSVSATPTVTDDTLYVSDWGPGISLDANWKGGSVYAIDRISGTKLWSRTMASLNGDKLNNISRSSPAIFEDLIIIADVQNPAPLTAVPSLIKRATRFLFGFDDVCGGYVYALTRNSGELVWSRKIGSQIYDQISQSPVVFNEKVYVGVSSHESTYTRAASVPCCSFRGSFVALNAHTGDILWQTSMIDESYQGFAGAAVWAGAPTIDTARNSVYVPTGNNYAVPKSVQQCVANAVGDAAIEACLAGFPDNDFDAIVALDLDTGVKKWSMRSQPYDAWTTACDYENLFPLLAASSSRKHCPTPKGPDSDFAQPPILQNVQVSPGVFEDRLFAGNKSGEFFAVNPNNGAIIWRKQVGPGGLIGGMQFGAASDGQRIYLQNSNFDHKNYTLEAGLWAGETIHSGFWAALDPVDGSIIWQTPVPNYQQDIEGGMAQLLAAAYADDSGAGLQLQFKFNSGDFSMLWGSGLGEGFYNWPIGGLTVVNDLLFAGVSNLQGTLVALNSATGAIEWQYDTGQSVVSTPSVVDGKLYWGTGYKYGKEGNRVYSFSL
jgi:polyvinyl alcohol dehydrogenase (cytochrome)